MAALFRSSQEGRLLGVVGDAYRFLATGDETDGAYAMWESVVYPGGGPPPHVHSREVECFCVLEGEMTFVADGERIVAKPGDFVHVPIGSLHSFKNESQSTARMIITVAPAGIEKMFFEVGVPLAPGERPSPPSPDEIERLLAVAPNYGVEIRPPQA